MATTISMRESEISFERFTPQKTHGKAVSPMDCGGEMTSSDVSSLCDCQFFLPRGYRNRKGILLITFYCQVHSGTLPCHYLERMFCVGKLLYEVTVVNKNLKTNSYVLDL